MQANIGLLIALLVGVLIVIWAVIRLLSSSYIKTLPTAAFVRTGGLLRRNNKPLVVVNGAAWVFNFLHRIKWVSLETMSLEVRHIDERALVTNDPQYVDLEARFFIKVGEEVASIDKAARTIGGEAVDEASIRRLAEPKINGAVRDVAATFDLKTLLEKRIDYIRQIQERMRGDLSENGLVLESVSILTLRPTLLGRYSTDDLLGAQVARVNSAIIEQALTEKNRLEKQGAIDRARQDAQVERERMGIEEEIEKERAQRTKNITLVRAAEDAEAKIAKEKKREEAELTRIATEHALQAESIENERQELLLREQVQRTSETERILREQAVRLAEQERERLLAQATAQKLEALKLQIEADSQRESALQAAMTLAEKAAAERQAEVDLINARLEADKSALESQNQVEIEAQRMQEIARAERSTASIQAEATRIRAEAETEAAKLAAVAERERASAGGLAEVQVALERVKVLEQEAEALRRKLLAEAAGDAARAEALASHSGVVQQLEIVRIQAETQKAVETARAEALGEAISGMKMNLFGDAAMASRLLQLVTTAQGAQAVFEALPPGAQDMVRSVTDRLRGAPGHENGTNVGDTMGGGSALGAFNALLALANDQKLDLSQMTLGELASELLENPNVPSAVHGMLQRLQDHSALRALPAQAVVELFKEWLA